MMGASALNRVRCCKRGGGGGEETSLSGFVTGGRGDTKFSRISMSIFLAIILGG